MNLLDLDSGSMVRDARKQRLQVGVDYGGMSFVSYVSLREAAVIAQRQAAEAMKTFTEVLRAELDAISPPKARCDISPEVAFAVTYISVPSSASKFWKCA